MLYSLFLEVQNGFGINPLSFSDRAWVNCLRIDSFIESFVDFLTWSSSELSLLLYFYFSPSSSKLHFPSPLIYGSQHQCHIFMVSFPQTHLAFKHTARTANKHTSDSPSDPPQQHQNHYPPQLSPIHSSHTPETRAIHPHSGFPWQQNLSNSPEKFQQD